MGYSKPIRFQSATFLQDDSSLLVPSPLQQLLGPCNTSGSPITIVIVSFIVIIVPLLSPYCY